MGWLLRKLAGKHMPQEGTITSCDIRAKTLARTFQYIIIVAFLLAIAFMAVWVAYSAYMGLVFDKGGSRGPVVTVLVTLGLIIVLRNSRLVTGFFKLFDENIEVFGIDIPSVFVFMFGLAISSTVIGFVYMHMSPGAIEKLSKPLLDVIGFITILAIALDAIAILSIAFGTGYFVIRFLYRITIGRPKTISYLMTNGEVVTATYPWYKATAIRLSLCKIYEV